MRRSGPSIATLLLVAAAVRGEGLDEALRLLPDREILGLVAAPSLKQANDELHALLEAMDRTHLLLGSRPLDQAKSFFGVGGGIDEPQAWIAAICPRDPALPPDPDGSLHSLFFIVPVTDAAFFFESNFEPGPGAGEFSHGDGSRLWGRSFGDYVVVCGEEPLEAYAARGAGGRPWLDEALGPRGRELLPQGDLFFLAADPGLLTVIALAVEHRLERLPEAWRDLVLPAETPEITAIRQAAAAAPVLTSTGARSTLFVIDFDPLALITRTHVRLDPVVAAMADGVAAASGRGVFDSIPARPYYAAGAMDLAALRAHGMIDRLSHLERLADWMALAGTAERVEAAVYPSPAGPAGGLLNDAVVFVRTRDARAARRVIERRLRALTDLDDGVTRGVTWEDDHQVEGIGAVTAYEVSVRACPADASPLRPLASSLVFGRMGWKGFVADSPDGVVMTFSRRPAVLKDALAAAAGHEPGIDDAAIRTMRHWIPADAHVQTFIGVGRLAGTIDEARRLLPIDLPGLRLERGLPPVGVGATLGSGGLESTAVIPAGVLAVLLDTVARGAMTRQNGAAP